MLILEVGFLAAGAFFTTNDQMQAKGMLRFCTLGNQVFYLLEKDFKYLLICMLFK